MKVEPDGNSAAEGEMNGQDKQVLGGKRVAQETTEQAAPPTAKKPRYGAGVKILPRRPSCELLHREPHLQALSAALTNPSSHRAIDMAITGTAGVGKTELVINFVASHVNEFQHVLWINAKSKETAKSSLIEVAKMLEMKVDPKEVHMPLLINKIFSLCSETKCMVVFDNAANPEMLQSFLPPFHIDKSTIFTVVTSQFNEWDCEIQLQLDCFTPEQSQQFLKQQLEEVSDATAEELAKTTCCLPLALQLAVSFIKHKINLSRFDGRKYTSDEMIQFLQKLYFEDFLSYKLSDSENIKYSKSLSQIYKQSLSLILKSKYGKVASKILKWIPFMNPARISSAVYHELLESKDESMSFENVCECFILLVKYSLATEVDHKLCMTSLMHSVLRNDCTDETKILNEYLSHMKRHVEYLVSNGEPIFDEDYRFLSEKVLDCWQYIRYGDLRKKYEILLYAAVNPLIMGHEISIPILEQEYEDIKYRFFKEKFKNTNFIGITCTYVKLLSKTKQHEKLLELCNEIEPKIPENLNDHNRFVKILHLKARSLYKLNKLDEAFTLAQDVYLKEKIQKPVDFEFRDLHLPTLKLLCAISCKMYTENPTNTQLASYWLPLMIKKAQEFPCYLETVEFLPIIEKYLKKMDQADQILVLYDKMQSALEFHHTDIDAVSLQFHKLNLIHKAKFLCGLDRLDESWDTCVLVHGFMEREGDVKPSDKQSLEEHVGVLKEVCKKFWK